MQNLASTIRTETLFCPYSSKFIKASLIHQARVQDMQMFLDFVCQVLRHIMMGKVVSAFKKFKFAPQ